MIIININFIVIPELTMGGRHSKRSVDINSTPKKDADGGQVTEKLEKIEEGDVVKVQNGHAEPVTQVSSLLLFWSWINELTNESNPK